MTVAKWLALVVIVAWALWFIRAWRTIARADAEAEEWEREEYRRRRALGAVTKLSALREIERRRG